MTEQFDSEKFRREMSKQTGLESRYDVRKVYDPTGKHDECQYFVLDPQHDPLAREALLRYSMLARHTGYTTLAQDIDAWLQRLTLPPERRE